MAQVLHDWGLAVEVPVLELLTSELVTNALVHGGGRIRLRLDRRDDHLRLEVTDDNGTPTRPHLVDHADLGGWGLHLVDRLADRWGASHDPHATRVWTEVRPRPSRP